MPLQIATRNPHCSKNGHRIDGHFGYGPEERGLIQHYVRWFVPVSGQRIRGDGRGARERYDKKELDDTKRIVTIISQRA